MVHEEWRIRSALQTPHGLNTLSFETEEYVRVLPPLEGTRLLMPFVVTPQTLRSAL